VPTVSSTLEGLTPSQVTRRLDAANILVWDGNFYMSSKERYQQLLIGPIERFDQRNDMFRRSRYDPEWIERAGTFYGPAQVRDKAGYTQEDYALRDAAW
jgi:hypothetical protein